MKRILHKKSPLLHRIYAAVDNIINMNVVSATLKRRRAKCYTTWYYPMEREKYKIEVERHRYFR